MSEVLSNFQKVSGAIQQAALAAGRAAHSVALVAVTKTHSVEHIKPVLEAGHKVFGENRVQEAKAKWPQLRKQYQNMELHLIGPLQSNKAHEAVQLFDVIQTIDRDKIAAAVASEIRKQQKHPKLLVQVNTGLEPQKAGIAPQEVSAFLERCNTLHGLTISGLMCIPPVEGDPALHFKMLCEMAKQHGLNMLSMGMSADFEAAIAAGATHVRVGSAIFGARETLKA